MKVAILGYSSIVERKVLPALLTIPVITAIEIYTRRDLSQFTIVSAQYPSATIFRSDLFFDKINAEDAYAFIYISGENHLHFKLAMNCLQKGYNIIVDKPICLSQGELIDIMEEAVARNCFVSEACTWSYHKQCGHITKQLSANKSNYIDVKFTIPMPKPSSFRVNQSFPGYGVFWDMSVYIADLLLLLAMTDKSHYRSHCFYSKHGLSEIIIFNAFSKCNTLSACIGFGSQYRNSIEIIGDLTTTILDRAFSSDPNMPVQVDISSSSKHVSHQVTDNAFSNYLVHCLEAIHSHNCTMERQKIQHRFAIMEALKATLASS
jgi:predicted dehydrogenase